MKTLNIKTKKAQTFINNYQNSLAYYGQRDIWNTYAKPSENKVRAYLYWVDKAKEMNGFNLTVVIGNCQIFTLAFETDNAYIYATGYNTYYIPKGV